MAQLVERRVRNAKARGSNPLISTKKNTSRTLFGLFFLWGISGLRDFFKNRTTVSPCEPLRADADAITEASRSLPTNPLISTTLYQSAPVAVWLFIFLEFFAQNINDFIVLWQKINSFS